MKNENSFNFIITLNGLTDGASTIIPILVTGSWTKGGREIDFTKADLDQAIANFQKLANHDLNMDYDHACEDLERAAGEPTPSAGRITNLGPVERFTIPSGPRKGEEVWILKGSYEPTERARELIRNREYRYVSAAFVKDYPDRTSGDSQGLTLTSVAPTNLFWMNFPRFGSRCKARSEVKSQIANRKSTMTQPAYRRKKEAVWV